MFLRLLILVFLSNIAFSAEPKLSVDYPDFLKSEIPIKLPDMSFDPQLPVGNYWLDSMSNDVYIPSYAGLRRVAYRIVDKCLSRLYRKALSDTLKQRDTYLPSEMANMALRPSTYYPWWERSAFDSLTVERGGSQIKSYAVGTQIEIFSIGLLSVYNDGKMKVHDWDIRLSHDSDKVWQSSAPYVDLESTEKLFRLDIKRPYSDTKKFWKVSGAVNLNVKMQPLSKNKSAVKASVKVGCKYASIRAVASYLPFLDSAAVKVSVTLLCF